MERSTKLRGGAASTWLCAPMVILALIGGCEEGDPLPDPAPSIDGGLDAATDVPSDPVDAGDAGPDDELDVDASYCVPPEPIPTTCMQPSPPSVVCGELVCSGATPRCCMHNVGAEAGPTCVAANAACTGGNPFGGNVVSTCDDAADCLAGEVCRDSFNQALDINTGAQCRPRCSAGDPAYRPGIDYQVCTQSCECSAGEVCTHKRCVPRP